MKPLIYTLALALALAALACGAPEAAKPGAVAPTSPTPYPSEPQPGPEAVHETASAEPAKPPPEKDQYHVYKLSHGACEVDMRSHTQFESARGTGNPCLGHFDYRMDADNLFNKLVKEKACKK